MIKLVYNLCIGVENMAEKISGIYKITNTITGDCYIGSSKNIKQRWAVHKCQSTWKRHSNNPMDIDMQKYGVDKFSFQILEEVEEAEESFLKVAEQQFIETLKPTYNQMNAKGLNVERYKKYKEEYEKTDKRKKYKEEYNNQLCCYNGETHTLKALKNRFGRAGIPHPQLEAKQYLVL